MFPLGSSSLGGGCGLMVGILPMACSGSGALDTPPSNMPNTTQEPVKDRSVWSVASQAFPGKVS